MNGLQKKVQLQSQLNSYGLNPSDWSLIQVDEKNYVIQNKKEKDFSFIGEHDGDRQPQWKKIVLFEI